MTKFNLEYDFGQHPGDKTHGLFHLNFLKI